MASTDLKLQQPGSLSRPGPIGRAVRLGFGALLLTYVFALWAARNDLITEAGSIRPLLWTGIVPSLFIVSYVVNIGFSRAWRKWSAIISVVLLLIAGTIGYLLTGTIENAAFARTLFLWELYVAAHFGLSFVLSNILATPGCEMRSPYHLFSLITGKPPQEHHCLVGPLSSIDRWECIP